MYQCHLTLERLLCCSIGPAPGLAPPHLPAPCQLPARLAGYTPQVANPAEAAPPANSMHFAFCIWQLLYSNELIQGHKLPMLIAPGILVPSLKYSCYSHACLMMSHLIVMRLVCCWLKFRGSNMCLYSQTTFASIWGHVLLDEVAKNILVIVYRSSQQASLPNNLLTHPLHGLMMVGVAGEEESWS